MDTIIEFKNVSLGYSRGRGAHTIVENNVNLKLFSGRFTCLLGLNGAGKSTLIKTACGFMPPIHGDVFLLGKPIKSFSHTEIASKVGVVLTEKTNIGGITAYDLVSFGRYPFTNFLGKLSSEDQEIILDSISAVGMQNKRDSYISELSDGELQKILIAKALAQESEVIILDEPTAFLDIVSKIDTMILLKRMVEEKNKTILLSTHDIELALDFSDDLWLLSKGDEPTCGQTNDMIEKGAINKVFAKRGLVYDKEKSKFIIDIVKK